MNCRLFLWIILASCPAICQECSAYVVIDPFDAVSHIGIDGLQVADFEAKMDNALLPIANARQAFNSRVLIMVQANGSAEDPEVMKLVHTVAELARQASPLHPVAFGIYGERVVFTKGFIGNWDERRPAIDGVLQQINSIGKYGAVFDALHEGLALFGQPEPGDTVVLVGDGHDVKSHKNDRDLEKEFAEHHARLLATVFTREVAEIHDLNRITKIERRMGETFALHELASFTGGAYTRGLTPTLVDFAWAGYLLEVKLPNNMDKLRSWKLQLRGEAAKAHKNAVIYQPFKLAPCGAMTASP